jgi:type II secretory pathway component PulC
MRKITSVLGPSTLSVAFWVLTVIGLVLCVALAFRLARWEAPLGAVEPPANLTEGGGAAPAQPRLPSSAYQALAENPVFGPPPPKPTGTPGSQLRVDACVVGTIIQGSRSLAIVEMGPSGQKLLRVGDALDGGRIVVITRAGLVLRRSGQDIDVPVTPSRRGRRAGASPVPAPVPRAVAVAQAEVDDEGGAESEQEKADVDLEELDSFIATLKKNAGETTAHTAHDVGGDPIGLLLDKVPEGSMLRRIGLLPGDLVTEVNTISVTSLDGLTSAFDKVAEDVKREEECFIVIEMVREQKHDALILTIW